MLVYKKIQSVSALVRFVYFKNSFNTIFILLIIKIRLIELLMLYNNIFKQNKEKYLVETRIFY